VTVIDGSVGQVPAAGAGESASVEVAAPSMLREVGQTFYLMGLLAASLALFLGLGLLAVWVLG
jgi:hypothetical protein